MIYVLVSPAFIDYEAEKYGKLIKIGYTRDENKDRRLSYYLSHNPTYRLLYTIPDGTEELEKLLHSRFTKLRYPDYGNEWYYWDSEIIDFFEVNKTVEDLMNVIDDSSMTGSNKKRFNGFKEYSYKIIDLCLNLKLSMCSDYTLSQAILDRDSCFQDLDDSKLILEEGVFKFILDYFSISKEDYTAYKERPISKSVVDFINIFYTLPTFYDKMKALCESPLSDDERSLVFEQLPFTFKYFYNQLGPVQVKACGYNITNIKKKLDAISNNELMANSVRGLIYSTFLVGEKYLLSEIKTTLGNLYEQVGYMSSPKATDLENHFNLKKLKITNKETGKRDYYYEILSKKD